MVRLLARRRLKKGLNFKKICGIFNVGTGMLRTPDIVAPVALPRVPDILCPLNPNGVAAESEGPWIVAAGTQPR
ncbi:MAG: hypothetical protein ACI9R3_001061 [Verrucomicrobiales bacterium]|jgi:hypothetical protein